MQAGADIQEQSEGRSAKSLYILQLLNYSGNAFAMPYINLYLVASGIAVSTVGVLLSIGALVEMIVPPILTTLADRHRAHRILWTGFILSLAVGTAILAVSSQEIVLAAAVILITGSFRPGMTLGLQLVITRMSDEGRQIVGRVRGVSSLGFGLASLLANPMYLLGGYFMLFAGASAAYLSSLFLGRSLPQATTRTQTPAGPRKPRTRAFYILVISMFFIMMAQRIGYAFWFVHFQQHLGVSTGEIAILAGIMALVEIPFFLLLDRMLRSVSVYVTFLGSGLGMALMWLAVGFLPDKSWIYPLIIFRGFVFAIFHLSGFLLIARVSEPENVATNQALAQGTVPSLATLLTGGVSGWVYEVWGATALFMGVAGVNVIGMIISIFAFVNVRKRKPARD